MVIGGDRLKKGDCLNGTKDSLRIGIGNQKEIIFYFGHEMIYERRAGGRWWFSDKWIAYKIKHDGTIDED